MARIDPQIRIRISEELKDWIVEESKENKRSLNSQIIYCIEQYKKAADRRKTSPLLLNNFHTNRKIIHE